MLRECLKFMDNFIKEESNRNIYDCRTFLARFVETHLSNFDEGDMVLASTVSAKHSFMEIFLLLPLIQEGQLSVTVGESLKKEGDSECKYALSFCQLFLTRCTGVFIPPLPHQSSSTPPLSELQPGQSSEEERLTNAFLLWYLSRILVLLGHQQCSKVHKQTLDVIQQLLQAVKNRDFYSYVSILDELLLCIADLVRVNQNLYDKGAQSDKLSRFAIPMDKVMKSLQDPEKRSEDCGIVLSSANFSIDSVEVCESLQLNLMRLIVPVTRDISAMCSQESVSGFWACLACNLEYGCVELKTETLCVCSGLMTEGEKLAPEDGEYFIDCLLALLEFLCSGVPDVEESEIVRLETAAASVIARFLAPDRNFLISPQVATLNILLRLTPMIRDKGLKALKTYEIKAAIGQLICHLIEVLSLAYLDKIEDRNRWDDLMLLLVNEIGCSSGVQFVVGPLGKAIIHELSSTNGKRGKYLLGNLTQAQTSQRLDHNKRKRKLDDDSKEMLTDGVKLGSGSTTYRKLIHQFTQLLRQDVDLETITHKAEGVGVIVEILVNCVSQCNSSSSTAIKSRLPQQFQSLSCWLSPSYIQEVFGFLYRTLQFLASAARSPEMINSCLRSVLLTVGAFLSVHELADFDSETYQTACWIASLPWLLNDPSWQDLKPANAREIVKIAGTLTEHLEKTSICESLWVLSLLPKDMASKWRIHVFRQALCDSNDNTKKGALQVFPVLLHHLGPNANHLVYDLIHPCMSDKSEDLEMSLATITGPLACIVSRKAVVNRPERIPLDGPISRRLTVGCMSCDSAHYTDVSGSPRERPKLVDPNMFSPFLELVGSKHEAVRLALIKSLRRIFGHIVVRKNNAATIQMLKSALALVHDSSYEIRRPFSQIIPDLVGEVTQDGSSGPRELVYTELKNTFTLAKAENNYKLLETLLLSLAQLGRVCDGDLLINIIIILLQSLLSSVSAVAYKQLGILVEQKKNNLFMTCRHQVCTFLAEAMHEAQLTQMEGDGVSQFGKTAEEILTDVSKVLGFENTKTFLTGSEKYLVPLLAMKGTQAASNLIKLIATHLSIPSRSKLLNDSTKNVFTYIMLHNKETEMARVQEYLERETTIDFGSLLRYHYQRVHNELLLHLSTHRSQVFRGLKCLATHDLQFKGQIKTNEEMANYLQPRILGVLAFFDSQLMNASVPMEEKRLALQSLVSIIGLMGVKIISGIRHKVMNTLRIGLSFTDKEFMEISCRAWNCFVRSIDISFLGKMLPQIVATLLPLLNQLPKQTAEIFNYMIVENQTALKSQFNDIYFLPEMPELSEANKVLQQCSSHAESTMDIQSQLKHTMKGIQHESLDVRLHALSKLKKLLQEQTEAYFQLVVGSESADSVVSELVAVLLKGCREPDVQAQRLYAECLGKCAAIDPGRLELSPNNPKAELAKFHTSIQDDNFAFSLINEVVKSYLAATEPRIQDCSSYALQELLSIYQISDTSAEEQGKKLWRRFPEHIRESLTPLISSRYMITGIDWSNLQKPIYCSKKGNTFKDWVGTWTGYLSSKVKQDKAYKVFRSCSALISKGDTNTALYILPYVVLHVLLDGSEQDIEEIHQEINEVLGQVQRSDTRHKTTNFHHMSAQTIFSVLDYLAKWVRYTAQMKSAEAPTTKGVASYLSDPGYKVVSSFLDKIPQDSLANVSYSCQAFTRALMHFEMFVKGHNDILQQQLDFMQRLYVAMDEPDGVLGVAAIRQSSPTLQHQILTHGCLGQQHEMQACYEQAIQTEPDDVTHHQGLLRGLMDLGQHSKALTHCTGAMAEKKSWGVHLNSYQIEAAWKLGNWNKLQTFIKADKGSRNWPVALGKVLLAAKDKKEDVFFKELQIIRQDQMGPLSAASMEKGSYQRGYEYIVRLHLLNEIEETGRVFLNFPSDCDEVRVKREQLLSQWQTRLTMMQSSFRIQEPVLTLRRTLLTLAQNEASQSPAGLDREIGQCWLWSAKIARKAGYLQTAYSSLLQASEYNMPEFCLEKAKWLWEKGDNDEAISLLEREMQVHFGDAAQLKSDNSEQARAKRKVYAQALLLFGRYSEETSNMESNAIVKQYKEVIEVNPELEDGYFYLAKYFDKIMTTLIEDKDDISRQGEFVYHVVKNFGQSLHHGNQFIYQSMPRMLSLWLDFGAGVVELEKKERSRPSTTASSQGLEKLRGTLKTLNKTIRAFGKTLAPYQLFFAFPQLISRLCHAHPDVFEQLKAIIARLVVSYPQQALWLLMAVSKSSYQMRVKRCQEIFTAAKEMKPSLQKVIQDYTKLTERLLELCDKDFPNTATLSVTTHFRFLKRLLDDSNFSSILLPLQSSMTVSLPTTTEGLGDHNPFPGNLVTIRGFEDTIEVLPSLQRPKKITMKGSDGRLYMMLCKPKDDLRKDCRLMEFNGIVNKFLRKDPESRKRSLNIRTYTVIPLNEECGLLEWVNNTSGLRHILIKLYREKGLYTSGKQLQEMMPQLQASLETKLQIYRSKLLPRFPPVFSEWFLRTFPDPTSWYNARLAYARTVAVMSMVGYILGLGDRHGENILFDSTSGDCVHVDFNCLFNRGETFEWPEKVPFRLTHNLVDAMGPLKLEGIYRRACEVTLRVMRDELDPLMSVLKPFVYDPLVEWSKPTKRANPTDTGEITNEQARVHVLNIEHRLKGILKNKTKPRGLALSVEGHVNYLIQEATDEKNLCQMYIGWAAYM